jgi:hypothetical protein
MLALHAGRKAKPVDGADLNGVSFRGDGRAHGLSSYVNDRLTSVEKGIYSSYTSKSPS